MQIDKITITGADDNVDINQLVILQDKFPFVEWGLLFSKNKIGKQRYPSIQWMNQVANKETLQLSAHYCGFHSREVLEACNFKHLEHAFMKFNRVQLNYNFQKGQNHNIYALFAHLQDNPKLKVILQYNASNSNTLVTRKIPGNVDILHDASGGRGKVIKDIPYPFKEHYTGYSGGIGPENIESILKTIVARAPNDTAVWIDMESAVRTNDEFDLAKVTSVLEIASKYVL